MAKTYRKATEKDISKGKGKSTDELSLAEATAYFNKRASETGAKKFRYKGEVYDLSGEKAAPKSEAKADKPAASAPKAAAKPAAPEKVSNTVRTEVPGQMPASKDKPRGRGDGASEVARRSNDAKAEAGRKRTEALIEKREKEKAQKDMQDRAKAVAIGGAAVGAAALGARAAMKGAPKAAPKPTVSTPTAAKPAPKTTVTVPKYNNMGVSVGRNWVPESAFTDKPTPPKKSETKSIAPPKKGGPRVGQSKAAAPTVARGAGGGVRAGGPVKPRRIGGGVGQAAIDRALNPFNFSKGGMVKKGKK